MTALKQKSARFEVDQSVRVEELNRDTVIGIGSLDKECACLIPKKVKRHFREEFRRQGKTKLFAPTIFAAAIAASLRQCNIKASVIVVDKEYEGYEEHIEMIVKKAAPHAQIEFKQIGRKSPAHLIAYKVFKKRQAPDKILTRTAIIRALPRGRT